MNKRARTARNWRRRAASWMLLAGLAAGPAWAQAPTTQYEYDALGNPTRTVAPLDRTTASAYDALRRPVQTTDPAGGIVRQSYNGLDQPIAVTDPRNLVTGYQYNSLGDLIRQTSPDTGTTQYTHDAAGNLLTRTDAKGQVTTYQYDALNRPVLVTYHDGSRVAYGWDAGGRLAQVAEYDSAGQLARSASLVHDALGRLIQETRSVGTQTAIVGYRYANGRLEAMLYPSGRIVAYTHDAAGRIAGIGTTGADGQAQAVVSQVQYHPFGGVKAFLHGNGLTHQRPLDAEGRLAGYSVGGQARGLTHDLASRIVALDTNSYSYDSLDRLVGAAVAQGDYGYGYDASGNRNAMTVSGNAFAYSIDAASNRLLSIGGASSWNYSHDANGSVLSDGTRQYSYDARGRLVQIVTAQAATGLTPGGARPDGNHGHGNQAANGGGNNRPTGGGGNAGWNAGHDTHGAAPAWAPPDHGFAGGRPWQTGTVQGTIQFDIDARNLRVRKSGPQGERYYHYDPAGRLIAESTAGGIHDREYLYLDDLPVAVVADGTLYHIDPDHLGTPRLVTNGQGAAVWRWEGGEPFGAQAPEEDPNQTGSRFVLNLRFPGQYHDAETQLHYNHHRDYDPATGRYVQSDPIGLEGGINTYTYVEGNPVSKTDPTGLVAEGNGNLFPGFVPQDGVCSPPAQAGNSNKCVLDCCKKHDACYAKHGCNASSWAGNLANASLACQYCNSEAVSCIAKSLKDGCCEK